MIKKIKHHAVIFGTKIRPSEFLMLVGNLSFSTAFSIVPTFALLLATANFMGDLGLVMEAFRPELLRFFGFSDDLVDILTETLNGLHFSELGFFGFLGLLYVSTDLISTVDSAVHRIWQERSRQFRLKRIALFWSILFFLPLATVVFMGAFSFEILNAVMVYPQKILPLVGWFLGLLLLNMYAPYEHVRWKAALIASISASVVLWILKVVFFWANGALFNYSNIYGSVAFLPLLLLWIKLTWQVVLGSVIFCRLLHFRMLRKSPLFDLEDLQS